MGYHRAGFDVVGVDLRPQPRYPFEFHQADALTFPLDGFNAIHASPPCQHYSRAVTRANRLRHPDLIAPIRERLRVGRVPYVIENVPRAPLIDPVLICGSSLGMPIQRHRLFESPVALLVPPCAHRAWPRRYPPAWNRTTLLRVLSISGGYTKSKAGQSRREWVAECAAAMGIDWMTSEELSESIPPAYTELIGLQLLTAVVHPRDAFK